MSDFDHFLNFELKKIIIWNQNFKFKISFLGVSTPGILHLLDKLLYVHFHPIKAEWWGSDGVFSLDLGVP